MKKAILTIVSGEKYEKIWEKTQPFFVDYAEKCDAELIVLKGYEGMSLPSPHWLKFSIHELLKKDFDRIAFIDADILIRKDSPNIFDIVPPDEFGIFNEGLYTPRNICIYEVMKVYNVEGFKYDGKTYYNTGVMVCSRRHRHIFNVIEEVKPLRNHFGEQTFLNMKIMLSGETVFPLPYKFNRMSIMDRITGISRLDSYFIHYAGDGERLFEKLDRDIEKLKSSDYKEFSKRNVFIWALGGIGDVISVEPVIRHIKEKVYPNDNIYLMSKDYEVFDHLDIHLSDNYPKVELDAVLEVNTHQLPWGNFGQNVPFHFTHCVDWVSLCALGRQLPDKEKQIKLTYKPEHLEKILSICDYPEELVLVHPGVGWESKTFPVEYWNQIIKGLKENGHKVGIIGRNMNVERQLLTSHTYLDVDTTGCVDFRDKLNLKELFALISKCKTLVTNDSAPVHVAGAFDCNIVLIPTCKNPDFIMPFRNGSKHYKAKALYKKLMEDDAIFQGDTDSFMAVKEVPQGHKIEEYLPDVEEIIETVNAFDGQFIKCSSNRKERRNDIPLESHGR